MKNTSRTRLSERAQRRIGIGATAVIAIVLVGHFAITALSVGPLSTMKLAHGPQARNYLSPYFEQVWTLFAPDPISDERGLLVRAEVTSPSGQRTTEWADITSEGIDLVHGNRVFPSRVSRLVLNGIGLAISSDPVADKIREREGKSSPTPERDDRIGSGNEPTTSLLTPEEQYFHQRALNYLQSLASAEAQRRWGDGVTRVQLRLVLHRFPPFSQRDRWQEVGDIQTYDLVWQQYAPPGSVFGGSPK